MLHRLLEAYSREKLNLFRVSRKALVNVMLKSTDCDSQANAAGNGGRGGEGNAITQFLHNAPGSDVQRRPLWSKGFIQMTSLQTKAAAASSRKYAAVSFSSLSLSSEININQAPI